MIEYYCILCWTNLGFNIDSRSVRRWCSCTRWPSLGGRSNFGGIHNSISMVLPTRKTFQGKHLAKFNMAEDEESMTNFTVQLTLPHLNTVGKTVPPPPPSYNNYTVLCSHGNQHYFKSLSHCVLVNLVRFLFQSFSSTLELCVESLIVCRITIFFFE